MTPEALAPGAAGDDFVMYDELGGPDLDAARWAPARLPLPTGGEHIPLDPNAELAVGEGEVRVTIPRFSLSHDTFQSVDSVKYLTLSARRFELPPDGPATFAADLAVENIGGEPGDYRRGIAAFQVADLDVSKRVFSVCGTSTRVFAMHEHLPLGGGGPGEPFIHVVESPYEDFDGDFTRLRACEITLDRSRSTAAWHVDGRMVYEAHGTLIPEHARIGLGVFTMLPIRGGRSRSLDGQGIEARWRRFRVGRGVPHEHRRRADPDRHRPHPRHRRLLRSSAWSSRRSAAASRATTAVIDRTKHRLEWDAPCLRAGRVTFRAGTERFEVDSPCEGRSRAISSASARGPPAR